MSLFTTALRHIPPRRRKKCQFLRLRGGFFIFLYKFFEIKRSCEQPDASKRVFLLIERTGDQRRQEKVSWSPSSSGLPRRRSGGAARVPEDGIRESPLLRPDLRCHHDHFLVVMNFSYLPRKCVFQFICNPKCFVNNILQIART